VWVVLSCVLDGASGAGIEEALAAGVELVCCCGVLADGVGGVNVGLNGDHNALVERPPTVLQ